MLIVMALAIYAVFDRQLTTSLDDTVGLRAEANLQLIDVTTGSPVLLTGADPDQELSSGEAVLRLYGADGALIADGSPVTGTSPEEWHIVRRALTEGRAIFATVDLDDDEDYRVVARPIRPAGEVVGVVVTGIERSRVDQPLTFLRAILLVAVPLMTLALGLAGYWIASRALRPVAAMTATAGEITRGDLHRRIAGADTHDELGHLASTLNVMLTRLGETAERERRFTADASHELRTPLSVIEAGIDVTLTQERDANEYRRVLRIVQGQTRRLHSLADRLLLLSRMDSGEVQAGFVTVDVGGLLEAVIESFSDDHRDAEVYVGRPADALEVHGDHQLVALALRNLLDNAAIHAGRNVCISITLAVVDRHSVSITIEDDGPGVPADLAGEVFRRFRRGDPSRTRGGAGLGLAIVETIATAHGGGIRLDSPTDSGGARFDLRIPLIVPDTPP